MKLAELRAFLKAAAPDETHLVLSATAGGRTLTREAESFGSLGIDRLVLTKLDEAASFGTLLSLVERLGTRVSFFTNGQEVPDHLEVARGNRLASLVMGGADAAPGGAPEAGVDGSAGHVANHASMHAGSGER
jgi:flagellar biosynthesis protein FlhF